MEPNASIHERTSRRMLAVFSLAGLAIAAPWQIAQAAEIVPSVGITRAVDGDETSRMFGGLAVRGQIAPLLRSEIAVAYRSESRFDGALDVRMWPITTSLYLATPAGLYAGAGVGWYHTSYEYDTALSIENHTDQRFGVHVGGGLQVPLAPNAGVDLNGRYVFMRDQESRLVPERFNPDFWSTSLGLAVRF